MSFFRACLVRLLKMRYRAATRKCLQRHCAGQGAAAPCGRPKGSPLAAGGNYLAHSASQCRKGGPGRRGRAVSVHRRQKAAVTNCRLFSRLRRQAWRRRIRVPHKGNRHRKQPVYPVKAAWSAVGLPCVVPVAALPRCGFGGCATNYASDALRFARPYQHNDCGDTALYMHRPAGRRIQRTRSMFEVSPRPFIEQKTPPVCPIETG